MFLYIYIYIYKEELIIFWVKALNKQKLFYLFNKNYQNLQLFF